MNTVETSAPRRLISITMPARNEEGNLPRAYDEVTAVMARLPQYDYEVIVIDNASVDRTLEIARGFCGKDARWKYVRFSRNFGGETSLTVGLRLAKGDAVINLFSDLQDPTDRIPDFIAKWEEGFDVVSGILQDRQDSSALRGIAARMAYRLIRASSDIDIPENATDFRLVSRRVVDAFNRLNERQRYVRGLMHWVGFTKCEIPYNRRPRQWGRSKAPFWWCFQFALNAITSFSTKPLKLFMVFGSAVLLGSILLSLYYAATRILNIDDPPRGIPTILVLLLLNLGVVSLGIGLLGEYMGHIYTEVKRRPLFVISDAANLDPEQIEKAEKNTL
ncbi:MAG TPA: glycosyltransferase family 2 protein [Kiritimatiellia bacterium]|nr:glycosyltransferase family 2 protein [Kiritimatiellia bacterium]